MKPITQMAHHYVIDTVNPNVRIRVNILIQQLHTEAQGGFKDTGSLLVELVLLHPCNLPGLLQYNESHLNSERHSDFKSASWSLQKILHRNCWREVTQKNPRDGAQSLLTRLIVHYKMYKNHIVSIVIIEKVLYTFCQNWEGCFLKITVIFVIFV